MKPGTSTNNILRGKNTKFDTDILNLLHTNTISQRIIHWMLIVEEFTKPNEICHIAREDKAAVGDCLCPLSNMEYC